MKFIFKNKIPDSDNTYTGGGKITTKMVCDTIDLITKELSSSKPFEQFFKTEKTKMVKIKEVVSLSIDLYKELDNVFKINDLCTFDPNSNPTLLATMKKLTSLLYPTFQETTKKDDNILNHTSLYLDKLVSPSVEICQTICDRGEIIKTTKLENEYDRRILCQNILDLLIEFFIKRKSGRFNFNETSVMLYCLLTKGETGRLDFDVDKEAFQKVLDVMSTACSNVLSNVEKYMCRYVTDNPTLEYEFFIDLYTIVMSTVPMTGNDYSTLKAICSRSWDDLITFIKNKKEFIASDNAFA